MKAVEWGRWPRRRTRNVLFNLESLEERTLLSSRIVPVHHIQPVHHAIPLVHHVQPLKPVHHVIQPVTQHVSVHLAAGTLQIVGDNHPNRVVIRERGHSIRVVVVSNNGGRLTSATKTVRASTVQQIVLQNGGGSATVNSNVSVPTTIYNGAGHTVVNAPPGVVSTLTDSVNLTAGTLQILGDNYADSVVVRKQGRLLYATVTTNHNGNVTHVTKTVPTSAVHQIVFQSGGGSSIFNSNASIPTTIVKGAGQTAVNAPQGVMNTVDPNAPLQWGSLTKSGLISTGTVSQAEHDLALSISDGGFTDNMGFVLNRNIDMHAYDQGTVVYLPADQGDAVWRTGLALIDAALTGDAARAKTYLGALRDYDWVNGAPVRYPSVGWSTPLAHDGFDTMLAGAYYAYTHFDPNTGVPQMAKDLVTKYIDFLISNQWHLYTMAQANTKGIDKVTLFPTEIADLKNVAQIMGIDRTITNSAIDFSSEVADVLRGYIRANAESALAQIDIPIDFTATHNLPGVPSFHFDLKLPAVVQSDLAEAIADHSITYVGGAGFEIYSQLTNRLDQAIDSVSNLLPGALDVGGWKSVIENVIQKVMPWYNYEELTTAAFFVTGFLQQQNQVITAKGAPSDPQNYEFVHDFFWQVMTICETRPEMVDLLMPVANNFYASISQHHMAPFAWFTGHNNEVSSDIAALVGHQWDNVDYTWQRTIASQNSVWGGTRGGQSHTDKVVPRLDFLIMTDLVNHGVPKAASTNISGLLNQWGSVGSSIVDQLSQVFNTAIGHLKDWIASESHGASDWLQSEKAKITTGLNTTIQSLKDAASQKITNLNDLVSQQTANYNSVNTSLTPQIKTLTDYIASETTRLGQWVTDQTNAFAKARDQGIAAWNNWISGERDRINGAIQSWQDWIASERDRLNQELNNLINQVSNAGGDPATVVQNGIKSLDGGKWESYLPSFGLTDDPIGALRQTIADAIASEEAQATQAITQLQQQLSQEEDQASQAITALKTQFDQNVVAATKSAGDVLKQETDQANAQIAGLQVQINQALDFMHQAEAEAADGIQNIQDALAQDLTNAQNSATDLITQLQAKATTLGNQITSLTSGLLDQASQAIVTAVTQNPNGDYGALANAAVDAVISNAGKQINTMVTALNV